MALSIASFALTTALLLLSFEQTTLAASSCESGGGFSASGPAVQLRDSLDQLDLTPSISLEVDTTSVTESMLLPERKRRILRRQLRSLWHAAKDDSNRITLYETDPEGRPSIELKGPEAKISFAVNEDFAFAAKDFREEMSRYVKNYVRKYLVVWNDLLREKPGSMREMDILDLGFYPDTSQILSSLSRRLFNDLNVNLQDQTSRWHLQDVEFITGQCEPCLEVVPGPHSKLNEFAKMLSRRFGLKLAVSPQYPSATGYSISRDGFTLIISALSLDRIMRDTDQNPFQDPSLLRFVYLASVVDRENLTPGADYVPIEISSKPNQPSKVILQEPGYAHRAFASVHVVQMLAWQIIDAKKNVSPFSVIGKDIRLLLKQLYAETHRLHIAVKAYELNQKLWSIGNLRIGLRLHERRTGETLQQLDSPDSPSIWIARDANESDIDLDLQNINFLLSERLFSVEPAKDGASFTLQDLTTLGTMLDDPSLTFSELFRFARILEHKASLLTEDIELLHWIGYGI